MHTSRYDNNVLFHKKIRCRIFQELLNRSPEGAIPAFCRCPHWILRHCLVFLVSGDSEARVFGNISEIHFNSAISLGCGLIENGNKGFVLYSHCPIETYYRTSWSLHHGTRAKKNLNTENKDTIKASHSHERLAFITHIDIFHRLVERRTQTLRLKNINDKK